MRYFNNLFPLFPPTVPTSPVPRDVEAEPSSLLRPFGYGAQDREFPLEVLAYPVDPGSGATEPKRSCVEPGQV